MVGSARSESVWDPRRPSSRPTQVAIVVHIGEPHCSELPGMS